MTLEIYHAGVVNLSLSHHLQVAKELCAVSVSLNPWQDFVSAPGIHS